MTAAKSLLKALAAQLSRLSTDRSGNIATMFAILIIPMIAMIGSAIDYSNAYRTKLRVQEALDATSLAVNRSIGERSTEELQDLAQEMFANNLSLKHTATLASIDIQGDERIVTLQADGEVNTFFMSLFGIDKMNFSAMSQTVTGTRKFEISMVLDNSGSMAGSKIRDLRTAADNLVEVFFKGESVSEAVKVGIAPFAASVNVGSGYRNASWIDSTGISPVHSENFDENVSRFDIYDNIANADWAGCVEMRPYPLDVQDTTPAPSDPASYFVPMFAPDEPDDESAAENNYLCDDPSSGGGRRRRSSCSGSSMTWDEAQMNVDKYYSGVRASGDYGPNHNCTTTPITPLTSTKSVITAALDRMDANGMTNIQSGVMWGWRVISNKEPFTEGVPSNDRDWIKAIVLMTDGANTHRGKNSPNMSMYSAFGYARNGRLGPPTRSTSTLVARMNDRTLEACTNVKADGILIYTVAFGIDDNVTRTLLRNCATNPEMAYTPSNGSELVAVFNQIGVDLSTLRIAQ
ncbi:MAG: pilus assembly protein [Hyphomicrobiales bacterium]|nr:pilus assembly protein [Hyphomicrobiales bacterium]